MALVEALIPEMPHTAGWKAGRKVQGDASIPTGTAIATFDPDGKYGNHTDGRSHAAVYVSQSPDGITVWDQWIGQPCHQRVIRFKATGDGLAVNNGIYFSVIESASA